MKKYILILIFALPIALAAQMTYVPDDYFEGALIYFGYDTPPLNDSIPTKNIDTVTYLDISWIFISDLTGIEDFIALEVLQCSQNNITNLDVSVNHALLNLDCSGNNLTNLDISNNPILEVFSCAHNQLTSLDVSNNRALIEMNCSSNYIVSLDVSNNPVLESMSCALNSLTSLDVSNNPVLEGLECSSNQLTNLDVSNNPALKRLYCNYTSITSLDVSNNTNLIDFICHKTKLTSLDVSHNPSLKIFICYSTNITSLDVSHNPNLELFFCYSTDITNLDVTKNPVLKMLYCDSNKLTSLDVSHNPSLIELTCSNNSLPYLNMKNGNNLNIFSEWRYSFNASNNPDLTCIQVDDSVWSTNNSNWLKDYTAHYSTNCNYTGVENELKFQETVSVSPNPASDFVEVDFGNVILSEAKDPVVVYDLLGIKYMDSRLRGNDIFVSSEGNVRIDISGLAAGVYFIRSGNVLRSFIKY